MVKVSQKPVEEWNHEDLDFMEEWLEEEESTANVMTPEELEEEEDAEQNESEAVIDRVVDIVVDGADSAVKEFLLELCTTGKTMAPAQLRAIVSAFVASPDSDNAKDVSRAVDFAVSVAGVDFEIQNNALAKLFKSVKLALRSPRAHPRMGCQHQRACHNDDSRAVDVEEEEQELLTDRLRDDFDCVEAYDDDELVEGVAKLALDRWTTPVEGSSLPPVPEEEEDAAASPPEPPSNEEELGVEEGVEESKAEIDYLPRHDAMGAPPEETYLDQLEVDITSNISRDPDSDNDGEQQQH